MNGWMFALYLYLGAVSLALVIIDLKFHRLPNILTLGSYPIVTSLLIGAAATTQNGFDRLARSGLAALAALALFVILHLVNRTGMGLGDVKLAPVVGAVLGWQAWSALLNGAFYAFVGAGLVAAVLMISKRLKPTDDIAFGPFMILGMWLAMLQIG